VKQSPEVLSYLLVTGQDADYLVIIVAPDMNTCQSVLLETITRISGGLGCALQLCDAMGRRYDSAAARLSGVSRRRYTGRRQ